MENKTIIVEDEYGNTKIIDEAGNILDIEQHKLKTK